jgi:hypothetical protein
MKEIDDIDINQLQKLIGLMNVIKMQEAGVNQNVEQKDIGKQQTPVQPMKRKRKRQSLNSNITEMI